MKPKITVEFTERQLDFLIKDHLYKIKKIDERIATEKDPTRFMMLNKSKAGFLSFLKKFENAKAEIIKIEE